MKKFLLLYLLLIVHELNGQINISGIVNIYRRVTSIVAPPCNPCLPDCYHQITVTSSTGFFPGDKCLIIQMKGANINTTNTAAAGQITAINNAGNYEFFEIERIVGNVLYTKFPLIRSYTPGNPGGYVQVVKIPKYDEIVINDTLKALEWDDVNGIGGVIAFQSRKVTLNAPIWVLGSGYQGQSMNINGAPDNCSINPNTQYTLPSTNNSSWEKGHGIVVNDPLTNRGRSPRANGGGSGISGDSGGGGGSNYGAGGNGGWRWCDHLPTAPGWRWCCGSAGTAAGAINGGGIGGVSLATYSAQDKVFMGGAGGPGWVSTSNPSLASDGGGIVIVFSDTIISNNQVIDASGTDGVAINPIGPPDGGGGGGAGGSVVLKVGTILGNLQINVNGGDGQDLNIITNDYHGPGGGGGGGVVLYSLPTLPVNVTVNVSGGQGGQHLDGFRNGSQDGQDGGHFSLYIPIQNPNYNNPSVAVQKVPLACDKDDDDDGIIDIREAYDGDHDSDGTPDYADPHFCTATYQGVNGWNCVNGLPDPSGDLDGDGRPNYEDPDFPGCGGLSTLGVCINFDKDRDGRPDHLDLDSDNDGVPDLVENGGTDINGDGSGDGTNDEDRDGILDIFDTNCTGVITSGRAETVYFTSGTVNNPANAVDVSNATAATLASDGAILDVEFSTVVPSGSTITIRLSSASNGGTVSITQSINGTDFVNANTFTLTTTPSNYSYVLTSDASYIRIIRTNTIASNVFIVNFTFMPCAGIIGVQLPVLDSDRDGISNSEDLDADNDGIPDIVEAGGVDTNGDGFVDGYNPYTGVFTGAGDLDRDGFYDIYDGTCTPVTTVISGNAYAHTYVGNVSTPDDALGPIDNFYANLGITTEMVVATSQANLGVVNPNNATNVNPPVFATFALMNDNGDVLTLDFGASNIASAGTLVTLHVSNADGNTNNYSYQFSTDGITFTAATAATLPGGAGLTLVNVTVPINTRYVRINKTTNNRDLRVHGVSWNRTISTSIDLTLTHVVPAGENITVRLAKTAGSGLASADIFLSQDGITYTLVGSFSSNLLLSQVSVNVAAIPNTRYVRVARTNLSSNNTVGVYWVSYSYNQTGNPCGVLGTPLVTTSADANNDGRPESYNSADFDRDGVINIIDLDSDNDGIPDVIEMSGADANGDGRADNYLDTDRDGLSDRYDSDADNNGTFEGPTRPLLVTGTDTNNDGKPESYITSIHNDFDSDNRLNFWDLDSDNDGIADVVEVGVVDANGDGHIDNFNDADNDGWDNTIDGDTDNNGTVDNLANVSILTGTDTDLDGRPNSYIQGISNVDGSGRPNYQDVDSDDDGMTDIYEAGGTDTNNDGRLDTFADNDNDGWANSVDGDADGNGTIENLTNVLVVTGTDADNNGKPDTYPNKNADFNGLPNFLDLDSDNDGIPDLIEAGGEDTDGDGLIDGAYLDVDNDGMRDKYDATSGGDVIIKWDYDGDGVTNYIDLDSDNDGVPDIVEIGGIDANGDGRVDILTDTDFDGLMNVYDPDLNNNGIDAATNPLIFTNSDANSDGIPDTYPQGLWNIDGQGYPNPYDLDSDGDGITDLMEVNGTDVNNDGLLDTFADADGDGWANAVDGDTDNNGTIDNLAGVLLITGTDTNSDGRPDSYPNKNADQLGHPNFMDLDSDGDGIPDLIEVGGVDVNGDGISDVYADVNNNGRADIYDTNPFTSFSDFDGDGVANYVDLDSDNDGIADVTEVGGVDFDGDGKLDNYVDADFDGLDNKVDSDLNNNGVDAPMNSLIITGADTDADGRPNSHVRGVFNLDGTGNPNPYDLDSDDDGLLDITEVGGIDTNFDGRLDAFMDSDNDGWANAVDGDADGNGTVENIAGVLITVSNDANNDGRPDAYPVDNADINGLPDFLDLDSDNDGAPDIIEAGGVDTNGDGVIDGAYADTDGDGIRNQYDASSGGVTISNIDTDNDGIPNYRDLDSDNDAIQDVIEIGSVDANGDGFIDSFMDSDYDGFDNRIDSDINHDGTIDSPTNPLIITGSDTNADGAPESYVVTFADFDNDGTLNIWDLDSDNDGIADVVEATAIDFNGDGRIDAFNDPNNNGWDSKIEGSPIVTTGPDANNDGRPDNYPQMPSNMDGLGFPNPYDLDADGDGLTDVYEVVGIDTDNNGQVDSFVDSDRDGWADPVDGDPNNDGTVDNFAGLWITQANDANNDGRPDSWPIDNNDNHGYPDFLDLDSDHDGIPDYVEASNFMDTNGDALPDGYTDTNGNGLHDAFEGIGNALPVPDTDNDGNPDIHDLDSDSDGISDYYEGQPNSPIPATGLDSDNDGIDDAWDQGTGTPYLVQDADNDGTHDFRDWNTDGDTYPDWTDGFDTSSNTQAYDEYLNYAATYETNTGNGYYLPTTGGPGNLPDWLRDFDLDGIPNFLDSDSPFYQDTDGDGLVDLFDPSTGGTIPTLADTDGDGIPNWRDIDNTNPLPVQFLSLNAVWDNDNGKVTWYVAQEYNVAFYELERQSSNGFITIQSVTANHSPSYTALDLDAQNNNLYRVKAVDFNGAVSYSNTVELSKNLSSHLTVYPNPFIEEFTIQTLPNQHCTIEIYNSVGQLVYQDYLTSNVNGLIKINSLHNLTTGVYNLQVNKNQVFRIVKTN